jgi:TonB family protein
MAREYPAALRNGGTAAQAVVRFRIETDGTVSDARLIGSSHPAFAAPSLRAIRALRYAPALVGGRPVAVWMQQPL